MNTKLIIDYFDGEFIVTVKEYDPLPFGNNPDEKKDGFKCKDEIELHTTLLKEGYYDKLKNNE